MPPAVCKVCGKALAFFNHVPLSAVCHDCWSPATEAQAPEGSQPAPASLSLRRELITRKQVAASFARAPLVTRESIAARSVVESLPRLVAGLLLVALTTFAGSCFNIAGGWISSLLGCYLGLLVVNKVLFARAHPLDKCRWRRFWGGAVLGYWCGYIPFLVFVAPRLEGHSQEAALLVLGLALGGYVLAFALGLALGLMNVLRTDRRDKDLVLSCYDEWQAQAVAGAQQEKSAE